MRGAGLSSVRAAAAATLAAGLMWAAVCPHADADEIGALDSFFQRPEAMRLQPAPLAQPAAAPVIAPQAGRPAETPRAELLLHDAGDLSAVAIPFGSARRSLEPAPEALQASVAGPPPIAVAAVGPVLQRLFGEVHPPLRDVLHRLDDPIRTGALLAAARGSALQPASPSAAAEEDPLPPAVGYDVDSDALGRRLMLIGLGLLAGLVVAGAAIFSFAPTGGATLRRR